MAVRISLLGGPHDGKILPLTEYQEGIPDQIELMRQHPDWRIALLQDNLPPVETRAHLTAHYRRTREVDHCGRYIYQFEGER